MSSSQTLAEYIVGLRFDKLPEKTVLKVKHSFADWFAAVCASHNAALSDKYVEFAVAMGGEGDSSIIGREERTSFSWAAFANGCLGHIEEVDDGHRMSIMHIGTVVLPVVFAYAEKLGASGKKMIEAAVCGYDLAIRTGECLGKDHYTRWHTTSTAGTFGAAAAAAKMLGLDAKRTMYALGHAGTQASGLWQFLLDGAVDAKPFHPGKAAFNGILAAELASRGVQGACRIFEGEKGFCRSTSSEYRLEFLTEALGGVFKVDETNFKGYPTCGQTHSMIDALKKILAARPLAPEEIERIEARVYRKAVEVAGIESPSSLEEAKFSNAFCLAALLVKGDITFSNLSGNDLLDPRIRSLMTKVRLVVDPELEKLFPACRPCEISVFLKDGSELRSENRFRKGDPENPMDRGAIREKFEALTERVLAKSVREDILEWTYDLERMNEFSCFRWK